MPNKNKLQFLITSLVFISLITTGAKCGGLPPDVVKEGAPKAITLNYYSVYQESSNMAELIDLYKKQNPHVNIIYKNLLPEEYEKELVDSLAEDRGPDIFSVHTTWMRGYQTKIAPLPAQIETLYAVEQGTIKKVTYTKKKVKKTPTLRELRDAYPGVVEDNQWISNQIWGLPLSIDSLVLFYNRDLLSNAGIQAPPKDWTDFKDQVIKLTKKDAQGNIIQAGAAIGTDNNVSYSADILSLFMMQVGAQMTSASGGITFQRVPENYQGDESPAVNALNFYTSFASPSNEVYTWNDSMPNSRQAFISGKVAYYFGYAFDIPVIQAQAPKIKFEVTEVPLLNENNKSYVANYWVQTVSKKSKNINEAWDFILFIAYNKDNNLKFLNKAPKKPAALLSLAEQQKEDLYLAPFANQLLTAKSWYKGKNASTAMNYFRAMISRTLQGSEKVKDIVDTAAIQINNTLQ